MNSAMAYARVAKLGIPALYVAEAAGVWRVSNVTAAQMLRRLAKAGLVRPIRHGLFWVAPGPIDPWIVLEAISAPYPAYASLYSALALQGALSQSPAVFFAVTLGRAHVVETAVGTFSLHRVAPEVFGGYTPLDSGAKVATLEKALFDLAYLSTARSKLFANPPELELGPRLNRAVLTHWLDRIRSPVKRSVAEHRLREILRRAGRRI